MTRKDDTYYAEKMLKDIDFILEHVKNISCDELAADEVLLDSMQFRLIQIAESANKLSQEYKLRCLDVDWIGISGLRNWLVHDYGNVNYSIVFDTLTKDIAILRKKLIRGR